MSKVTVRRGHFVDGELINPQDKTISHSLLYSSVDSAVYLELCIVHVAIYLDEYHCIMVLLPTQRDCCSLRQRRLSAGIKIHRSVRTARKRKKNSKMKK